MALINGYLLNSIKRGVVNPYLSCDLLTRTSVFFPYSQTKVGLSIIGHINRQVTEGGNRKIKGYIPLRYQDVFYNGIHITPSRIDLGNLVTTQELKLYVWNAHFTKKRLTAINGVIEGFVVDGKQAPYTFQGLEEQGYKLSVTTVGASTIDDEIEFNFNDEKPTVIITGDRIVAFGFMPNWESGITETLEWSTDILTSESGFEQRSALFLTPRRIFQAEFIIHVHERQYFNNMMSLGTKVQAIPLWPYVQTLVKPLAPGATIINCTTKDIEFSVDGFILLWRDVFNYEVAEIVSINNDSLIIKRPLQRDWVSGTRLYPAKEAYFSKQPNLVRKTDNLQMANVEFFIHDNNLHTAVAPANKYLGYPVLMLRPDESEDLTSCYHRLLATLDNGMALPKITDVSGYSFLVQDYKWLGMGREERVKFRELIYFLNGCQKAVWIPSHADDLTVVDPVSAREAMITINQCGYTRFAKEDPDKKHIVIYLADGSYYFRTITGCELLGDKERLVLDSPLNKQLLPNQISRICFMRLCRSNNDSVEIKHITDSEGVASSRLTFKRVRDNEL